MSEHEPSDVDTGDSEGPKPHEIATVSVHDSISELARAPVEPHADGPETIRLSPNSYKQRLGRFAVVGTLGRGGMGTVLEAYDHTLVRTVALKLLHGAVDQRKQERLLREAQALAQLSHPNVVQIYEIGIVEDQMFIAMELVHGETLRRWQRRRRPWRQVVEVYRQAGRGLAAAHAEGIIHRDFKPDNCIIGSNGRVRVLDFGLARGSDPTSMGDRTRSERGATRSLEDSSLHRPLTNSGKLLGTLSYLPLAQLLGLPADAKSDQYSFCVSLHEALYGMLPYADGSVHDLIAAQEAGRLQRPPRGARVPRRLRAALLRGLDPHPTRRWPSMEALLAELGCILSPRRRWPGIALAMTVAGFGSGAWLFTESGPEPCSSADMLDGTWGPSERKEVAMAFARSGHAQGAYLYTRVEAALDDYAREWSATYESSCRATFVSRTQSETMFDLRMRCLERRRSRARAVVDALVLVDDPQQATERTVLPFKLPPVERCAALELDDEIVPLPEDDDERERVQEIRRLLDDARTMHEAGSFERGLAFARSALIEAREVDHPPVLAESLETLGLLLATDSTAAEAQLKLEEAIAIAARVPDDRTAARAWSTLIYALMLQGQLDDALSKQLAATAAVDRAGDEIARGWLLNNLGSLHGELGDFDRARHFLEQALEVKQGALGEHHFDVGIAWFNLGQALSGSGEHEPAATALGHAAEIFAATVGEQHPHMAFVETGLGQLDQAEGRLDEAEHHYRRALQLREDLLGPHDLQTANSSWHLGELARRRDRLDEAVVHHRRALVVYVQALGPEHHRVATSSLTLAELELDRGQPDAAVPHAKRAIELLVDDPEQSDELAAARVALARALPRGDPRALPLVEAARPSLSAAKRDELDAWLGSRSADPAQTP